MLTQSSSSMDCSKYHCSFAFFFTIIICITLAIAKTQKREDAVRGAYWPSWSNDTHPSQINTTLYTHIYFAFVLLNNNTFELDVSHPTNSLLRNLTTALKDKKPRAKTLISIGGGTADPNLFANMSSSKESRGKFINSTIKTARQFDFDGLDLDWEFPANSKEMEYLSVLLKEWRTEIQKEAHLTRQPELLLTAAVYFSPEFLWSKPYRRFPARAINQNLDLINVMCYDYRGSWDTTVTGAHAALYDPKSNISTYYGLNSWIRAGVRSSIIVMGLPLYGRSWKLKNGGVTGINAPAVGVGDGDGVQTYASVVKFNTMKKSYAVFDLETVSEYSYNETNWVGYDGIKSLTTKAWFAQGRQLRGYFFWALGYDFNSELSTRAYEAWVGV